MQVTLNSLYLELVDAVKNDKSELSLINWLQEKASSYDVCYYLFVLINFVMNILIFIQGGGVRYDGIRYLPIFLAVIR